MHQRSVRKTSERGRLKAPASNINLAYRARFFFFELRIKDEKSCSTKIEREEKHREIVCKTQNRDTEKKKKRNLERQQLHKNKQNGEKGGKRVKLARAQKKTQGKTFSLFFKIRYLRYVQSVGVKRRG